MYEAGHDINLRNNYKMSPLYLAILNNNIECAEFLVYNEATVYYDDDAQSKDTSPIFLAIRMKAKDILE